MQTFPRSKLTSYRSNRGVTPCRPTGQNKPAVPPKTAPLIRTDRSRSLSSNTCQCQIKGFKPVQSPNPSPLSLAPAKCPGPPSASSRAKNELRAGGSGCPSLRQGSWRTSDHDRSAPCRSESHPVQVPCSPRKANIATRRYSATGGGSAQPGTHRMLSRQIELLIPRRDHLELRNEYHHPAADVQLRCCQRQNRRCLHYDPLP